MMHHFNIILILLLKTFESAVPDNDGEANIIKAIMTNYKSAIRYFYSFFRGFKENLKMKIFNYIGQVLQ
jgi:hypothetical protein